MIEKWRASLASGEPFRHEARVVRADGEYRWMLHHKVAVRDECGQIVKWNGSSVDIEDRKRAEVQLRQSTEQLQRSEFYLAEGQRLAHMGSWAFDPAGFDYWSPELFRMHGLDPAGKPPTIQEYLDSVHPQDRESMVNLIKGLWAKASPFDATKRIVRPDGEVRYIRCVSAPVVENDSLKKYVGSALDVTEHELVTQELRRREAYLTEAQRLSHTGSFGWRPDDGGVVWSDETYRIFEYDSTLKPTPDSFMQRVHPQDRALVQQVTDRASQAGNVTTDLESPFAAARRPESSGPPRDSPRCAQGCTRRLRVYRGGDRHHRRCQTRPKREDPAAWSKPTFWESSSRTLRTRWSRPTGRLFYKCCNTAVRISVSGRLR